MKLRTSSSLEVPPLACREVPNRSGAQGHATTPVDPNFPDSLTRRFHTPIEMASLRSRRREEAGFRDPPPSPPLYLGGYDAWEMSGPRAVHHRSWFWNCGSLAIALGAFQCLLLATKACAATNVLPSPAPAASSTNLSAPPPLPPLTKSPVELFRNLLAMAPMQRRHALTNRPAEGQQRILAKLGEYDALKPEERELRLRATELRWYLLPLLSLPPTNRIAELERVPSDLRKLVSARLEMWDVVPPPLQTQILDDDRATQLYFQLEISTPKQRETLLEPLPPQRRAEVEAGFKEWVRLSVADRQKLLDRVNQFFDLTPKEKTRVLATLSEAERQQMEETLRTFERLPRPQRIQCIQSFVKFASLGPEERSQFFKNAERWQAMTPAERESWRKLVREVPLLPPLPPEDGPPRLPNVSPRSARSSAAALATNAN